MFDLHDLRATIIPKSDQLNAEQLLAGPMTVTVESVSVSDSAEQPVTIHYHDDDGRPYKPCKTMRKVLILAWGQDGSAWAGKSMTLYNDPSVKFGGAAVGGVRISHMSDIPRDIAVSLTATKGKKAMHTIKAMQAPAKAATKAAAAGPLSEVRAGIKRGDASGAAAYLAGLPQPELDAIWSKLGDDETAALTAAWPATEGAA